VLGKSGLLFFAFGDAQHVVLSPPFIYRGGEIYLTRTLSTVELGVAEGR